MTKIILRVALMAVVAFILLLFFWSDLRSSVSQTITRLVVSSEDVSVSVAPEGESKGEEMDLEIVTLLGVRTLSQQSSIPNSCWSTRPTSGWTPTSWCSDSR